MTLKYREGKKRYGTARFYTRFFIFSVALCCLFGAVIHPGTPEQLEEQLKNTPDPGKSAVLNKLSEACRKSGRSEGLYRRALEYAQKALEYAKTHKQEDREIDALTNIGWSYIRLRDFEPARKHINMAIRLAESKKNQKYQEKLADPLYALSALYSLMPDYPAAVEVLKRLEGIYAAAGNKDKEAYMCMAIGNLSAIIGKKNDALRYRLKALKLYTALGNQSHVVFMLEKIGHYYASMGDNAKALDYFLQAIKTGEKEKLKEPTFWVYLSYAEFLINQKNYKDAAEAIDNAINISGDPENNISPIEAFYWKAVVLKEQKEYDPALEYLDRALQLQVKKKITPYSNPVTILMETGRVYFKKKEYALAVANYEKALDYALRVKNAREQAACYKCIAQVQQANNQSAKATINAGKSLDIALKINDSILAKDNYHLLSQLSAALRNYKKAYQYHRLYAGLKDKIYTEKSAKSIAEMKTRFQTEKKEQQIELLKKDQQVRELKLSRQRLTIIVAVTGLVLIGIIMVYFGKKYSFLMAFWKKKHFIGNYKVMDKIASGGMAIVYKAHDIRDKSKIYAVKVLREEFFDDAAHKMRFKHEASIIDEFNHPNIVKISERGESGGSLYIVMELIDGKTLSQLIEQEGTLPAPVALNILIQVFDALVKIHQKNIIHRDLKPDNIMLVNTPGNTHFVKLLDFGLAKTKAFSRLTQTGMVLGTIYYMSPEQVMDTGISTASDVYAMGVIGCEMLIGRKPFDGDTEAAIISKILENKPLTLSNSRGDIPKKLQQLLERMINKNPQERPSTQEVLETLRQLLDALV